MATRVCIVGTRRLIKAGVRHDLSDTDFEVACELDTLAERGESAGNCDIFLLDRPDGPDDFDCAAADLKAHNSGARIVVLAETLDGEQVAHSFAAGVDGYLLADISPEALCESLRLVMLGEKVFPSRLVTLLASRTWTAPPAPPAGAPDTDLSEREVAIVERLTGGMPNKVIASELTITEATVKVHLKSIMKKIGVSNRTQAAVWAVNNGMANRSGASR